MDEESSGGRGNALAPQSLANLKPWKPGQSGNPSGFGRLSRELRMYIAGAEGEGTKEDVDGIRELARTAKSEYVRLQARTWLAEQVVGKSTQPVSLEDKDGNVVHAAVIILPGAPASIDGGDDENT